MHMQHVNFVYIVSFICMRCTVQYPISMFNLLKLDGYVEEEEEEEEEEEGVILWRGPYGEVILYNGDCGFSRWRLHY